MEKWRQTTLSPLLLKHVNTPFIRLVLLYAVLLEQIYQEIIVLNNFFGSVFWQILLLKGRLSIF